MMYNQNSSSVRRLRGLALVPALVAALAVTNIPSVASVLDGTSDARLTSPLSSAAAEQAGSHAIADRPAVSESGSSAPAESSVIADKVSEKTQETQTVVPTVSAPPAPADVQADPQSAPEKTFELTNVSGNQYQITEKKDPYENMVFTNVEKRPEFPGGEAALMKFVSENLRYPKEAHENKVQGRVVVRFVINKYGAVDATEILRGADPLLDAEAERVVKMLPKFQPGEINGQPVAVYYVLPITFKLTGSDRKAPDGVSAKPVKIVDGRPVLEIDGKDINPEIYLNGKLYEGKLTDLDPKKIKSIAVEKDVPDKPNGVVSIQYDSDK